MDKENLKKYLELLELDSAIDAEDNLSVSLADIKEAYKRLKTIYTSDTMSMAAEPIEDEFSPKEQQEILEQLEDAYKALVHFLVEKDRVEKEVFKKAGFIEDTVVEYIPEESGEIQEEAAVSDLSREEGELLELPEVSELLESQELIELPEFPEVAEVPQAPEVMEAPEVAEVAEVPEVSEKPAELAAAERDTPEEEELQEIGPRERELDKTILEEMEKFEERKAAVSSADHGDLVSEDKPIKGRTFRKVREKFGLGIHDLAVTTGISYKLLVDIEKERYQGLPEPGYLRWLVTTYAKALALDPKKAADDYMIRYRDWQRHQEDQR